ncbi:hypothetical protein EYC80_009143 [Monilinia laxa]|uniref:Extracellular membrane protein CFEM domain-containing protein n=1 Tax=Monilinia laxa TaxID=61186 RepID=A0A5N6K2N9_MONLA|nr:hypothetical protein EYC80_009143 [Monilinia laxa]
MQFSTILTVLAGLTLVAARPAIPAALQTRVEECSCADAQGAYAVCLLETCGHGCNDNNIAPCVASVKAEFMIDCGRTAIWDRMIFMIYDKMIVWAEMVLLEFTWKIRWCPIDKILASKKKIFKTS